MYFCKNRWGRNCPEDIEVQPAIRIPTYAATPKAFLVKGRWHGEARTEGFRTPS